jgi:propanediol dehydratase small subunit
VTRAASGTPATDLSLDTVVAGSMRASDIRIGADALEHQARVAESDGNPQLAENLRRAAELTAFADGEVLAIYDALRPGRASRAELDQLAGRLAIEGAPRCAALIEEALAAYERSGLLRS